MADYAEALARAKELAAKFSNPGYTSSNGSSSGAVKRPADNLPDSPPSSQKRFVNDKVAQAAEIAARLNQKIGGPTNPNAVIGNVLNNPLSGGDGKQTIVHKVPDGYVGLIIGKKGEQITRIQRESGCNVQIAPDSGGLPDRSVTLTGTPEQIDAVKRMFQEIINNARPNPTGSMGAAPVASNQGQHTVEVSIPGQRAGLIIGKSGETIKQLQEQTGTKMVLIQDSNAPSEQDKPLRITGEYANVEKAKQMVVDLLNAKGVLPGSNSYGNRTSYDFAVPAEKAGLVIGRGGETIKDISRQSGARLEIQKQPPPNPNLKIFTITGEQSQIDIAIRLICERTNLPHPGQSTYGGGAQYGGSYYGGDPYGQNAWPQQQQPQQQPGQWNQSAAQPQPAAASPAAAPSINPQTGQPDYTAAWVEYYRRQGMHEQANAILRMSQGGAQPQAQQAQQQPTQPQQQQHAPSNQNTAGGYDYAQWQQYQQWQQQQQQQQYPNPNAGWGQPQHPPGTGGGAPPRSG